MVTSLSTEELYEYLKHQLDSLFYDKYKFVGDDIKSAITLALERIEFCYAHVTLKNYHTESGAIYFNHLHGDQYAQFLYYFSNSLWNLSGNRPICDKIIQLNKVLHGVFITYHAGLPDIFAWVHPIGTILGNAEYSNYFVCNQECTVGTRLNRGENGETPKLGKGLFLGAGAKIIDFQQPIGDRVMIGAGTSLFKGPVPDDSLVIRDHNGRLQIMEHSIESYKYRIKDIFNINDKDLFSDVGASSQT